MGTDVSINEYEKNGSKRFIGKTINKIVTFMTGLCLKLHLTLRILVEISRVTLKIHGDREREPPQNMVFVTTL